MKRGLLSARLVAAAIGLAAVQLSAFGLVEASGRSRSKAVVSTDPAENNPCTGPKRGRLRCPDLQMKRPSHLYVEHTPRGRALLESTSAVKSRGSGPIELHGRRIGQRTMRVTQRIYRVGGGHLDLRTGGRLDFYYIPGQGRYWKFRNAARFELWSVDGHGRRKRLVRTGPKLDYCLRDLTRTSASRRSPRTRVYPGCNQDARKRWVTLGTSVGWSDVYPASYYEQYIDVTGLRGCFAYVHVADPKNYLRESHEQNNEAQRIVRLPFERGPGPCP